MSLKNIEAKELVIFLPVTALIAIAFSFVLFGITGARVVLGLIFISFPFYFILNNFEIAEGEKFVFSVLLGLTAFPSLVYILGFTIPFKVSIAIVFIILIAIAIALKYIKPKNKINSAD